MNRCLYVFFVVLLGYHYLNGQTQLWQEKYAGLLEEINEAKDRSDTLKSYKAALLALTDSLAQSSYSKHLPEIKSFYKWMASHPEMTPTDIRRQYMIYGHRISTYTTSIDEAIQCYLKAHQAGETLGKVEDYFWVENPLATIYNMKGDHEQSLFYYNYTRKGLERLINDPEQPPERVQFFTSQWERVLNNIAYLYYWNQEYQKALDVLEKSYNSAYKSQNITALVFGSRYSAEIYTALEQYEEAKAALSRFKELIDLLPARDQPGNLELYHQLSGILSIKQGDCTSAINHFKITLEEQYNPNRFVAKNHNRLANAYQKCNDPQLALIHIQNGLSVFGLHLDKLMNQTQEVFEENTVSELLTTAGDYYLLLFEKNNWAILLDSVLLAFQLSLQTLEMLRDQYLLEGSKSLSMRETRDIIEKIISLQYRINEIKGTKEGTATWPYMAKSKNVLLSDFDRERKQINNLPEDEQKRLKEKYGRIRELTSQLVTEPEQSSDAEDELVRLRKEIEQSLQRVKITGRPIKPDKSPFIEYLIAGEELFVLDNLTGALRFQKLITEPGLESMILGVQSDMKNRKTVPEFYKRLHELYRMILQPLEPLPPQFTIYPDGALFLLPFPALIKEPQNLRYVVQDHIINTGYLHEKTRRKQKNKPALFAIAPVYPQIDGMLAFERGNLYHLPFAEEEVRSLEKKWQGSYRAEQVVDKGKFFALLEKEGYLHFAGHSLVNASGAWLALSTDTASWVTYEEISKAIAGAQGVVLSACETGLGKYTQGEGVNSLAKSFLNAGVSSVVYSLWTVNDQTTAILMDRFYQHLQLVGRSDQALALAQRDFLDMHDGSHPYYWAAFAAADHTDYRSVGQRWWWWLGALVAFTLMIYLFFHYKHNKS